jgi:energy-coupling factor transporter transmembrane protein EcfT
MIDDKKDTSIHLLGVRIDTIRIYLVIVLLFTILAIFFIIAIYIIAILSVIGLIFTFWFEKHEKTKKVFS